MTEQSNQASRRQFLAATGGVAAAVALPTSKLWAQPAATAVPAPESVVAKLYTSLSDQQREAICFAWNHVDPQRGLLRTRVSNNWRVTRHAVGSRFFTDDQRAMVRDIMRGVYNPEWIERIDRQLEDDGGGWRRNSIALFGDPTGGGKFEFVMTGRHQTVRCDGDSADHVAFGGPIFYGHAADGFYEGPQHPGNVYWPQAVAANQVYQMLDAEQREAALVRTGLPPERSVGFRQPAATPGIPVAQLSQAQREHLQVVLKKLIEPYRAADQQEALRCLAAQGGLDNCRLSYYAENDLGNDGVWDNWRLEGPAFVWQFRGAPHVHVWVNVADDPRVKLNA